jgi:histidine triad (HIT) family protein
MNDCLFCRIAAGNTTDAVVLYQNAELLVFLDVAPIRRGHIDIIPREHYEGFELIPHRLAGSIMVLGQDLAKRLKATYGVQRVAFLFTGGDVPHAHAHVIPMHYKTDVTSARYILNPEHVEWGSAHLRADQDSLLEVRSELGFPP